MSDTEKDKTGEDDAPARMPKWVRLFLCSVGLVLYVIALVIVYNMIIAGKESANVATVAVMLLGIGTMLLIPWDYLEITKVKVGSVEFERVASKQETSRAKLEKRVSDLEGHLAELVASGSGSSIDETWVNEHKKNPEEQNKQTKELIELMQERQGRFMNITRILRYARDAKYESLRDLDTAKLREVATQLVANGDLEVKISVKSGNRLYRS